MPLTRLDWKGIHQKRFGGSESMQILHSDALYGSRSLSKSIQKPRAKRMRLARKSIENSMDIAVSFVRCMASAQPPIKDDPLGTLPGR